MHSYRHAGLLMLQELRNLYVGTIIYGAYLKGHIYPMVLCIPVNFHWDVVDRAGNTTLGYHQMYREARKSMGNGPM